MKNVSCPLYGGVTGFDGKHYSKCKACGVPAPKLRHLQINANENKVVRMGNASLAYAA